MYMNGSKTVTANFFVPSSTGIVSGTIASLTTTTGNPLDYFMLVPPNAVNLIFKLSGGTGDVDLLVNAMARFAPPAAGQTTLPTTYQTALNTVIAANWK